MMNIYNYEKAMYNDIMEYIAYNVELKDYTDENELDTDLMREQLSDQMWADDSITGNGSGSYYYNRYKAREAIQGNEDTLIEALEEFGDEPETYKRALIDPEYADCTIRCYLLDQVLTQVIEDIADAIEEAAQAIDEIDLETLYNELIKGA